MKIYALLEAKKLSTVIFGVLAGYIQIRPDRVLDFQYVSMEVVTDFGSLH